MAEDIALPGEKLKTFRKEAGLTLKAVADELKVSIPFLSMVENGKSGISFENLHRMLRLYGKNLGDLTEQEEKARGVINVQESKKIAAEPGIDIYGLASINDPMQGYMAGFILDIAPGASNDYDSHTGLEYVFVLKGCVRLTLEGPDGTRSIEMQAGDSKGHLAGDRHIYENIGGDQAQILVVESTPGKDYERLRHF